MLSHFQPSVLKRDREDVCYSEMKESFTRESVTQQGRALSVSTHQINHTRSIIRSFDGEMDGVLWIMEESLILRERLPSSLGS